MNASLRRYRPIWLSAIITFLATFVLEKAGLILINPDLVGENIMIFGFWWLLIAFLIYRFENVKNKRKLLTHVGTLGLLAGGIFLVEFRSEMTNNPLTIGLFVAFWLYLAYSLAPVFFKKYQLLIIGVYALITIGFIYFRLFIDDYDKYHETFILLFLWPIPVFIGLWFFEQWKWFRSVQAEKAQAELALLKSQINPHFFFNTLNNLYSLTVNQSKEAPAVIVKLSDMMRYTIYEGKKEWVAIEEEVEYLQNYIELHQMRHHQKVAISFEQDIEKGMQISPLLFIVLLENAFKHGAEKLVEGAYIKAQLIAKDGRIYFSIENNFDPEELSETKGIGLENLRRRLELVYPGAYALKVVEGDGVYRVELNIEV